MPLYRSRGWRRVAIGRARHDAAVQQTTGLHEAGANAASGTGGGLNAFYLDPADFPSGALLRVRNLVLVNDVAPTSTFTVGLYPVSAPAGAAATVSVTLGTVVTGSTAAIAAPAANSLTKVDSSTFAVPAAGFYALAVVISVANMAASSAVVNRASLDVTL